MRWYWGSFITGYRPLDNYGGDLYLKDTARQILIIAIEEWLNDGWGVMPS